MFSKGNDVDDVDDDFLSILYIHLDVFYSYNIILYTIINFSACFLNP